MNTLPSPTCVRVLAPGGSFIVAIIAEDRPALRGVNLRAWIKKTGETALV